MSDSAQNYDIVIVGAGPTGLLLSTCLARWGYKIKHVDIRSEATQTGRADGIQPRSLDFLCNTGLKADIMARKPGSFSEVAFWDPSIGARYPFTTTLHQGIIENIMIQQLEKHNVHVQRPWSILDFSVDMENPTAEHPIRVTLQEVATEKAEQMRTKYLFSGEGAKSSIREKLGIQMSYRDSSAQNIWGVLDARVSTNFPDVMLKCNIHSESGSMMIIPREGGLVRFYVQLAPNAVKDCTLEDLKSTASTVLSPYELEWEYIDWHSSYKVRQGMAEQYSSACHRIFLGGDACHTHSPKAGQGMNTAFLDAQNLAWKIHAVERGLTIRSILRTYESERMHVAKRLLDFDAAYSKLFSQQLQKQSQSNPESEFIKVFRSASEFTSGYGVSYPCNDLNVGPGHFLSSQTSLLMTFPNETRLRGGHLFPALDVIRVLDGSIVNLEQAVPFNGDYRIYIFAGRAIEGTLSTALADFARYSSQQGSYYSAFSPLPQGENGASGASEPSGPSMFSFCTILAAKYTDVDIEAMLPRFLTVDKDQVYSDDFGESHEPQAHQNIGITPGRPAVAVVRPDGYVGCTVKLVEGPATVNMLNRYFGSFVTRVLRCENDG